MSETLVVSAGGADPRALQQASRVLQAGGLVGFPTRHAYGLGADPFNPEAIDRVFRVKGRASDKPILILIDAIPMLERLAVDVPRAALKLMDQFWPGGLTLVLPAHPDLPPALTAGTHKIGVRLAGHPVARQLAAQSGGVVTGTSANLSGQPAIRDPQKMQNLNPPGVDLILDAGTLDPGPVSTVVDVSGAQPVLLREGVVAWERIQSVYPSKKSSGNS